MRNIIYLTIVSVFVITFYSNRVYCQFSSDFDTSNQITLKGFKNVLENHEVDGCILIYDLETNNFYSNSFDSAKKGKLPASTFKIPNSLIAMEIGLVKNENSILKWDGKARDQKIWEKDLTLKQAFHLSCVPCFQEIARQIGTKRMDSYLSEFEYGQMDINRKNLDKFWLEGESNISPFQQIKFLMDFYESRLPISNQTEIIMKRMMVIDTIDYHILSGKTGWSKKNGRNNGWFVGYLEIPNNNLIFAVNLESSEDLDVTNFLKLRTQVLIEALGELRNSIYSLNYRGDKNEVELILENISLFSELYISGDYQSLANMYCADGMILPPGADIIEGRDAIKQRWVLPEGVSILKHKIAPKELSVKENWAYDIGYYKGETLKVNGDTASFKGKYMILWKKEEDDWKIYADTWNRIN